MHPNHYQITKGGMIYENTDTNHPAIGFATCVFWFTLISGAAAATVWDMATPYPDGNFHTQNIKLFADDIAKGNGR